MTAVRELFERGVGCHRAGDLAGAERCYEQVLLREPGHADARHMLGVVAHQRGEQRRACELIGEALKAKPEEPYYHNNLGEALRAGGDLEAARESYARAVALWPGYAEAHNNLGLAWLQSGHTEEALACFEKALRLQPAFCEARLNLGKAQAGLGQNRAALQSFEQTLAEPAFALPASTYAALVCVELGDADAALARLNALPSETPGLAESYASVAAALAGRGPAGPARECYARALALDATNVPALQGAAELVLAAGDTERAVQYLLDATHAAPRDASLFHALAQTHMLQGALDLSERAIRRAIELQPQVSDYHSSLGWVLRDKGLLEESTSAIEHARRLTPERADLLHNLALTYLLMGRVDEAAALLREALRIEPGYAEAHDALGKCLRAKGDLEGAVAAHRQALAIRPDLVQAWENLSRARRFSASDGPEIERLWRLTEENVFCDRLRVPLHFALAKMLDDCAQYDDAFQHYRRANSLVRNTVSFDPHAHARLVERTVAAFDQAYFTRTAGLGHASDTPVFVVGMLRSGTTLVEQILCAHPQVHGAGELSMFQGLRLAGAQGQAGGDYLLGLESLDADAAVELARQYLRRLRRDAPPEARRATDKMPGNFLYLGLIATLFPNARVVHCTRDPLDVCLSIYFQPLTPVNAYAFDLYEIGCYYREYRRLMDHWYATLPLPIHEVVYEDLVEDLEAGSRALVAACGLGWDARCLGFYTLQRNVQTASDWQVRQPIYSSSIARWRHYEAYLEPLMKGLEGT